MSKIFRNLQRFLVNSKYATHRAFQHYFKIFTLLISIIFKFEILFKYLKESVEILIILFSLFNV